MRTSMTVPQFKLSFDVGHGDPKLTEFSKILLTHGHMDHSSGLPYYISQRALRHLSPPQIFCPPEFVAPFKDIMDAWAKIEGFKAKYELIGVVPTEQYELQGKFFFQAVPSVHRVPSNGYVIQEKTVKLKDEFKSLPGPEIARLKKERDDLFYESRIPTIAFSGDTQIEFVLENEIIRDSKILFLECTYISPDAPVERARKWGHIHLDEIVANAEAFQNTERLFLIHFSPRHRNDEIRSTLKNRLPGWLFDKTVPCIPEKRF